MKLVVAVLLELSVELHVTSVAPSAKMESDAGKQVTGVAPSNASSAVGDV